jgi:hypothetical protein
MSLNHHLCFVVNALRTKRTIKPKITLFQQNTILAAGAHFKDRFNTSRSTHLRAAILAVVNGGNLGGVDGMVDFTL